MSDCFEDLKGLTLTSIDVDEDGEDITFKCSNGDIFQMDHSQDCCERVLVDDIVGELNDLVDSPILMAEKVSKKCEENTEYPKNKTKYKEIDCGTWTFYKLATIKGSVTIKWFGSSDSGYYSEEVDFYKLRKK